MAKQLQAVSIMTVGEAKGHGVYVDMRTLERMQSILLDCGKTQVKADHETGLMNVVGYIENPRIDGQKLVADLTIIDGDPIADKVATLAETMPELFGLSPHIVEDTPEAIDGKAYIRPKKVFSVDVVTHPSTNQGLYEEPKTQTKKEMSEDEIKALIAAAIEPLTKQLADMQASKNEGDMPKETAVSETQLQAKLEANNARLLSEIAKLGLGVAPVQAKIQEEVIKEKSYAELVNEAITERKLSRPDAHAYVKKNFAKAFEAAKATGRV
jgi:hypothetical protein